MTTDQATDGPVRRTVLLVDDDAAVRRVAAKALRRAGYQVFEAESGEQALDIGRSRAGEIALLLTDVVMPRMNGRELSERLREANPELAVLFMSAHAEDEVFLQGVTVAKMNFIPKPFTLNELAGSVAEVLNDSPASTARRSDQDAGP